MKTFKRIYLLPFAAAIAAASLCATAQAGYRCAPAVTPEDARACEMASRGAYDDLRRFIQRTQGIYGLFFYDYLRPEGQSVADAKPVATKIKVADASQRAVKPH